MLELNNVDNFLRISVQFQFKFSSNLSNFFLKYKIDLSVSLELRLSGVHDGDEPVPGLLQLSLQIALQPQRLAVSQRHHSRQRKRYTLVLPEQVGDLPHYNTCRAIFVSQCVS